MSAASVRGVSASIVVERPAGICRSQPPRKFLITELQGVRIFREVNRSRKTHLKKALAPSTRNAWHLFPGFHTNRIGSDGPAPALLQDLRKERREVRPIVKETVLRTFDVRLLDDVGEGLPDRLFAV